MADVETCYRHPERLTGAHCTRCGRPVCPECMVEAPVGHQCPTCVGEGQQRERQGTRRGGGTQLGGRVTTVVKLLIVVNCGIFLLTFKQVDLEIERYGQLPVRVAGGQYYRLITAAFLHVSLAHLAFNMIALLLVGPPVEVALGRARFLALYLLSALGGSVCAYLFGNPHVAGVGASGAIFGVFGAFFVIARSRRSDTSGILILIGINLVFSFTDKAIDWHAHVGGLVVGLVVSGAFALAERRPDSRRATMDVLSCLAVLAVLVLLVSVRTPQLRA
jgi:membrane associated rhomboid family serine protease